jgi:hypothetical protein
MKVALRGFVAAGLLAAMPAMAHHSFAAYDMRKVLAASGSIKSFRWGAPHSSMVLVYRDAKGNQATMSVVGGSPAMFSRQGFSPRDFRRGARVSITFHPNANGVPGGALSTLRFSNGRIFSDAEATQARPRNVSPAG